MKLFDHCGAIHLHSVHSFDGRIEVAEIMKAAGKCGLDYIMLTDHSNLDAKAEEGWHDGVLLVVGQEISPRFNHYLAFGCKKTIHADEGEEAPPQQYIDKVNEQGGFGFIAHPDHKGTEMFHVKHYPWTDWSVSGFAGMSVWDFMTDWQEKLTSYHRGLMGYLCPPLVLSGPKKETIRRWDSLSLQRRIVGIGELDNHDTLYRLFGIALRALPFERAFKTIHTHLLTERPPAGDRSDVALFLDALRRGRAYIAMEYFSEAKGFSFTATGTGRQASMGDEITFAGKMTMAVRLPEKGRIRLLKDGATLKEKTDRECEYAAEAPGVYRCEVYQKHWGRLRPWIFSNPIYLRAPL